MFEIEREDSDRIRLAGRFDAAQEERAKAVFDGAETGCTVDFRELEYISSAGLGVPFGARIRLMAGGETLRLENLNPDIREIF